MMRWVLLSILFNKKKEKKLKKSHRIDWVILQSGIRSTCRRDTQSPPNMRWMPWARWHCTQPPGAHSSNSWNAFDSTETPRISHTGTWCLSANVCRPSTLACSSCIWLCRARLCHAYTWDKWRKWTDSCSIWRRLSNTWNPPVFVEVFSRQSDWNRTARS